jgi:hypothetical protein
MTANIASKDFGLTRFSYFDLAGTTVTAELCLVTGQQQVRLGRKLVSSQYGWRNRTEHNFELAGQRYRLVCQRRNCWQLQLALQLWQGEQLLDQDWLDFRRTPAQQQAWYWLTFKVLTTLGAGLAIGMMLARWWLG